MGDANRASPFRYTLQVFLTFAETQQLLVALAAGVATAAAVGVAVSASAGTVGFAAFFDRFSEADLSLR